MNTVAIGNSAQKAIRGAQITVTRPNNAIAYAAGQVWGAAADARIQLPAPALQADQGVPWFNLRIAMFQARSRADAISTLYLTMFPAQPAAVLGDQAAFNLSDADIALLMPSSSGATWTTTNNSGTAPFVNEGAAGAGRRLIASVNASQLGGAVNGFTPGVIYWLYLRTSAAYNPLALEQIFLFPFWLYTATMSI